MKKYIIDASQSLINQANKDSISAIAHDLTLIKQKVPSIEDIILRGGCSIDVISGFPPNDVDLFYTYKIGDILTSKCMCDSIREQIKELPFQYFKDKEIDLENAYEKDPKLSPIERTVGMFSYHTEYNSQFAIDDSGRVWTNTDALHYFRLNTYEMRYEGFLPWAYFPHEGDSQNYWAFQTYMLIRGIGHITKRNLIPGQKFLQMLNESNYLVTKAIEQVGVEGFIAYARKKIKSRDNFVQFVNKYVDKDLQIKILEAFQPIIIGL